MKRKLLLMTALLCWAGTGLVAAQGPRGGGMQGGGQGRQGMPGMGGQQMGPPGGQNPGMGQQKRQQMHVHATQQQQTQYRNCTQSTEQVRSRIRQMSQLMKRQSFNTQQALQLHQQLQNELQTIQQQREQLMAGLDAEQKASVQNRVQQVNRTQMDLNTLSDALGFELDQADPSPDRLRDQVRKMDRTSKQLQQQERDMAADAGIQ